MQQLINFIQKYKYFLFFILLEFVALFLTINNHAFHKSKFISSANSFTGGLYEKTTQFSEYLDLKKTNEDLAKENARLKNEMEKVKGSIDSTITLNVYDSTVYFQKYRYTLAKAINNKFSSSFNFLTLNRGKSDSIDVEMAVTNDKGIVGIIDQVSNSYARVRSILNKNSSINARVKGDSTYFGNLTWDGKDIRILQLENIPRQAIVNIGDTVITGGKSAIFPEGVLIGVVNKINSANSTVANKIDVQLFNDMQNIRYVYVISNLDKREIRTVENQNNE